MLQTTHFEKLSFFSVLDVNNVKVKKLITTKVKFLESNIIYHLEFQFISKENIKGKAVKVSFNPVLFGRESGGWGGGWGVKITLPFGFFQISPKLLTKLT